jgi:hypothetical protein
MPGKPLSDETRPRPRKRSKKRPPSRLWQTLACCRGFCVRFLCGAVLGLLLGFLPWLAWHSAQTDDGSVGSSGDVSEGWLLIPACALLLGVAFAWWGDVLLDRVGHQSRSSGP